MSNLVWHLSYSRCSPSSFPAAVCDRQTTGAIAALTCGCARLYLRRQIWIASLLAMTVSRRAPHSPAVIARLDRATQYSRDACDGIEEPRRTGYPAGACHRARRRRDPVAGYDGRWSEERRDE